MICWGFTILFIIFGFLGLVRGELPLTKNKKIAGTQARVIGGVLIFLAILGLITIFTGNS